MRLLYQVVGLILGFIIGLMTAITSLAYFVSKAHYDAKTREDVKSPPRRGKDEALDAHYESRLEAEKVLDILSELIMEYGSATVQDLKLTLGLVASFADRQAGWKTLSNTIIQEHLGTDDRRFFTINFPDPITL